MKANSKRHVRGSLVEHVVGGNAVEQSVDHSFRAFELSSLITAPVWLLSVLRV